MRISRRWFRAALTMATIWATVATVALLGVLIWAVVSGRRIGGSREIFVPFAYVGAITFAAGLMFAVSISIVGRRSASRSISVWSGAAWGGCAGAAIAAAALLLGPRGVDPMSAILGMAQLIGIGGAFGAAIVGVATRPRHIGSGAAGGVVAPDD